MAKKSAPKADSYRWCQEVFGRQKGQVEAIDPKEEPRLATWLAAGLVVPEGQEMPKPSNAPKES